MVEVFVPRDPGFRDRVEDSFHTARFVEHLGISYGDTGPGWCEARMLLTPNHLQQNNVVHGGAVATLADHTAGSAATSLIGSDEIVLSVGYSINLLRPGSGEALRCRGEVVRNGRRLIIAQSDVYAIANDTEELIARATVTLAVLPREHVQRRK
jgi:uncharacterized protein (TIGR00369 family)